MSPERPATDYTDAIQCIFLSLQARAETFLILYIYFFFWRNSPQGAMASSFTRILDHTQRRITVLGFLWTSGQLDAETCT